MGTHSRTYLTCCPGAWWRLPNLPPWSERRWQHLRWFQRVGRGGVPVLAHLCACATGEAECPAVCLETPSETDVLHSPS